MWKHWNKHTKIFKSSYGEAKINLKKKFLRRTLEIIKLVNLGNLAMFPLFIYIRIYASR